MKCSAGCGKEAVYSSGALPFCEECLPDPVPPVARYICFVCGLDGGPRPQKPPDGWSYIETVGFRIAERDCFDFCPVHTRRLRDFMGTMDV